MTRRETLRSVAHARANSPIGMGIMVVLSLAVCVTLFYRPVRGLPGPDLMPLLSPMPPPDEGTLTPHRAFFYTSSFQSQKDHPAKVSVHSAPLPGGARVEARFDKDGTCRVIRMKRSGEEATIEVWKDRDHFGSSQGMPTFTVSPDGRWVLYSLLAGPTENMSHVRVFPVAGGPERQWDIPVREGQRGITAAFWRRDSTGWLAWDDGDPYHMRERLREQIARAQKKTSKAAPHKGGSGGFGVPTGIGALPSTLWTADVDSPNQAAHIAIRLSDKRDYPAVIGPIEGGKVLALDCTDTRFTSRYRAELYPDAFGTVNLASGGYFALSLVEREKDRHSVRIPLVTFEEEQGVKVFQRTTMPLPSNCDTATLVLSPDGHTLAFWVRSQAGYEPQMDLLRQWNPKRFGDQVLRSYGGFSLWIGDVRTGSLRLIGKIQTDQNNLPAPLREPLWSADGTSLLFQASSGGEYRSLKVSSTSPL